MAEWDPGQDDWEREMEEDQWNRDMQMQRDNEAWRDDAAWEAQWQQWADDIEDEDFEIARHRTPGRSRSVTPLDPMVAWMNRFDRRQRDFQEFPAMWQGRFTPEPFRYGLRRRPAASGNYGPLRGVNVPRGRRSLRRGRGRIVRYMPWRSEL